MTKFAIQQSFININSLKFKDNTTKVFSLFAEGTPDPTSLQFKINPLELF
ncbi:MAG: hypothetical protein WCR69_00640 [Sulfuricurvum sp.]